MCSCAFFLYILHIYTHFQTTLFLFPFSENIFSDDCLPSVSVLLFLFDSVPFLSLLFFSSLLSTSRKHKRVRVFPIRFRPQFFFLFFPSPLSVYYTLARIDVFADAKCAHTHIQKKKTEDEEDEHTHTHTVHRKSSVVVEHDFFLFSTFFLTCAR
jgi:hypothetical protein